MSENQFKYTPYGQFYAKDIESLYALTIISLNLSSTPTKSSTSSASWFHKGHPFCFTVEDANETMTAMSLDVNNGKTKTTTTIRCGIKRAKVNTFLRLFLDAHLLHCASDRTKTRVKGGDLLQPTPKGLNFVLRYCRSIDYRSKALDTLLLSTYNSMCLITFERSLYDDRIVQSKTFIQLLFKRIMGPRPNIYSHNNRPDPIVKNTRATLYGDYMDYSLYSPVRRQFDVKDKSQQSSRNSGKAEPTSPFFHRFYSHPDSTAVCQYYVNTVGVRMFAEKQFPLKYSMDTVSTKNSKQHHVRKQQDPDTSSDSLAIHEKNYMVTYRCCFTSKALGQWLMDCTDVLSYKEVAELLVLFVQENLIEPIVLGKSSSTMSSMVLSSDAYYAINANGLRLCQWPSDFKQYLTDLKKASSASTTQQPASVSALSLSSLSASASSQQSPVLSSSSSSTYSMEGNSPKLTSPESFELSQGYEPVTRSRISAKSVSITLENLLKDAGLNLLFRDFLEQNRCQENLLFYNDMDHLNYNYEILCGRKKSATKKYVDSHAEKLLSVVYAIYNRYFRASAPHELNLSPALSQKLYKTLFSDITDAGSKGLQPVGGALSTVEQVLPILNGAKKTVYRIMATDTMPKFLQSEGFLETVKDMSSEANCYSYVETLVSTS